MAIDMYLGVNLNDDGGPQVNRFIYVVAILSTPALNGRLTARRLNRVSLGPSDYTLLVGWLTASALSGII